MIILKSQRDLELMRPACAVAGRVLDEITAFIKPGLTTRQVDEFAAARIKSHGGKSAFLGYRKYPCQTCISVNDEVVHGLAGGRELCFGDCGVLAQRLMDVTERALHEGIAAAVPGNRVTDISRAVQNYVEGNGFSVVREFVGHGVGRSMHEEPQVPNFVDPKSNQKLRPGMTLAIEPMVNAGQPGVKILKDGWTVVTQDGSLSAHFEQTVLVTESEPEILTWPEKVPSSLKVS